VRRRSPQAGSIDLAGLRALFLPEAIIAKVDGSETAVMSVESFIEPREDLLNSGRLLDFAEWEISANTEVFGRIAQRWCVYAKSGCLDGAPFEGWGRKAIHFVRLAEGWRISAIAWHDGAEGSSPPGSSQPGGVSIATLETDQEGVRHE
jgi:hypothetical protein